MEGLQVHLILHRVAIHCRIKLGILSLTVWNECGISNGARTADTMQIVILELSIWLGVMHVTAGVLNIKSLSRGTSLDELVLIVQCGSYTDLLLVLRLIVWLYWARLLA